MVMVSFTTEGFERIYGNDCDIYGFTTDITIIRSCETQCHFQ